MNILQNNRFAKNLIIIFFLILYAILFISCKEDAPVEPTPDPFDSLAIVIDGPSSPQMVDNEYKYVLQLDGSQSKNVKNFLWKHMGPGEATFTEVDSQATLTDTLRAIGEHQYRLVATSMQDKVDSASFSLNLNPLEYTNEIWAWRSYPPDVLQLATLNPEDFSITPYLTDIDVYIWSNNTLSKSPNGKELLVNMWTQSSSPFLELHIFDIASKSTEPLVQGRGNHWFGEFSPLGDYVAFGTDGRYSGYQLDELAIVNVNTREVTYFAPDPSQSNTGKYKYFGVGQSPTWSPDGQEIALGNARDSLTQSKHLARIFIYSDIYSGNPQRRRLHSEEYLQNYLRTNHGFGSGDFGNLKEGINGMDWSPDGSLIAYPIMDGGFEKGHMVIARADGSGIVKILSPDDVGRFIYMHPTWSPDSQTLMFTGGPRSHFYTVDRNGNNLTDVTPNPDLFSSQAAWSD